MLWGLYSNLSLCLSGSSIGLFLVGRAIFWHSGLWVLGCAKAGTGPRVSGIGSQCGWGVQGVLDLMLASGSGNRSWGCWLWSPSCPRTGVCLLEGRIGAHGIPGLGLPTGGQSQVLGSMTAGPRVLRAGVRLLMGRAGSRVYWGWCQPAGGCAVFYDRLWVYSDLGAGVYLWSVGPWPKGSWGWCLPTGVWS